MRPVAEHPTRYDDPLARIDWRSVDLECWWLPPQALSLTGVAEFEALPVAVRRRLSQFEYAHLLAAGLWLESVFIERLSRLAFKTHEVARRLRYLEEIREEAGHSLMFVELMRRGGFALDDTRGIGLRLADVLGRAIPSGSALFWVLVVIGEELIDRLNHRLLRGIEDVTLSAVVYHIAQIHVRDEAAHVAYARTHCDEAARRLNAGQRALFSPLLSRLLDVYATYAYFPPAVVYERAGLTPGAHWRMRARNNSLRRRHAAEMLRPTLEFLRRIGWNVSSRYAAG